MAGETSQFKRVKLNECATFQEGYVNPSQGIAEYFGNEVKWLRAVDLNDSFVWETSRRLSKQGYESAGKASLLFEPDTLAISKSETIGRLGILKDYMCGNRAVINIKTDRTNFDTRFIFYSLLIRRREIESRAVGSVQPNLYCSALGDIEIEAPPLAEQKAIAAVLGALDDKIELNRRMNATLESMARALFQSWFVDFDPVRAKLDGRQPVGMDAETASLFPDTFERYDGDLLPTGWRQFTLEDAMDSIIDYRGKTPTKTESGVPLVTAKIVKDGRILPFGEFIAVDDYEAWMRRGIPKAGDIVMTTEAPLGEVAQLDDRRVALAQRLITLRGKPGVLDNSYLRSLMQSPTFQTDLHARASGTTVLGIRQSELRKMHLFLPPMAQQTAFANFVIPLTTQMDKNWCQTETLATLRDTLLPKLLSGELSVADAASAKTVRV